MYQVYVLRNPNGRLYIGQTRDVEKRLREHNLGLHKRVYTRRRGPWELALLEEYPTRSAAVKRERSLKAGQGRAWLKSRFSGA